MSFPLPVRAEAYMTNPYLDEMEEAADLYVRLVPSLIAEAVEEAPQGCTDAELALIRRQVAWAALARAADRGGMSPVDFAKDLLRLRKNEKALSYWHACMILQIVTRR
jgi:hypothetical protein